MLNLWQIIFLALLQGVTELFPISSLGHTVIFPALFWLGKHFNGYCMRRGQLLLADDYRSPPGYLRCPADLFLA